MVGMSSTDARTPGQPYDLSSPALALTIAGSEATGGAGAQADLKTFQELGVFGMVALTCIVSFDPKNDWGHRFVPVEAQVIADQLEAIQGDYADQLTTTKLGMMGSPATISTVATALKNQQWQNIVLDPVLICKGQEPGHALDTDQALKAELLPLATFTTPNHFEAEQLSGMSISSVEDRCRPPGASMRSPEPPCWPRAASVWTARMPWTCSTTAPPRRSSRCPRSVSTRSPAPAAPWPRP